jgi:hypothetical protein
MEDIKLDTSDTTRFGIQGTLVLNLGFSVEEHKMIPELLTPEEYDNKIDAYLNYGEYDKMELECIDSYGAPYSLLVNKNILAGSYFKFQRVNIQTGS